MTAGHGRIRLIVSDLDGTILRQDLTISARVRAAIAEARTRGTIVVLASGRMYRSVVPYAQELGLRAPVICYQGAYVRELPGMGRPAGGLLFHRPLRAAIAREAVRWTLERGLDPHANVDDRLIMAEGDENAADYERALGVEAELVPDLVASLRRSPTKILAVGPAGLPERLLPVARAAFAGRAEVTVSHPEYLEFTAPGITKGRALRWLCRRLDVPPAATLAIGDQYNDLEMIVAAGIGVAMGQAPAAVRAAARAVTGTIDEDGAALAIEAFVLGRPVLD